MTKPGVSTRSQTAGINMEQQSSEDSSNDGDSLDNTLVEVKSKYESPNAANGVDRIPGSNSPPVGPQIVNHSLPPTADIFSSLISTMASLQSAINELRQDTRKSHESSSSRDLHYSMQSTPHPHGDISSSIHHDYQQVPTGNSPQFLQHNLQRLPQSVRSYITPSTCNTNQPTPSVDTYIPPSTCNTNQPTPSVDTYIPPSTCNTNQPTPSVDTYIPPSTCNTNQRTPSILRSYIPPSTSNAHQLTPSVGSYIPPSTYNTRQPLPSAGTYLPSLPNNQQHLPSSSANMQQFGQQFLPPLNCTHQLPPPTSISTNIPSTTTTNWSTTGVPMGQFSMPQNRSMNEFNIKLYDLPHFDGKPEEWPLFLATYIDTSIEFGYSDRQNMLRLQKALRGRAKDAVLSMLIYPENVSQVIDELKFSFGRPELLVESQLAKIDLYPAVTEGRLDGIIGLATCAKNVVAFFRSAKCENYLVNPTLLKKLVLKLPLSKQYEWAKVSASFQPFTTVEHFSTWVGDLARICSLMPKRLPTSTNDRQQPPSSTTRRVLHSSGDQSGRKECLQCKGGHGLTDCQQFKDLAVKDKWDQVKRFRVCFGCLRKGHSLTQCRMKSICTVNGCNRYHHPILHQDKATTAAAGPEQPGHVLQCHQNEGMCQLFKILPVMLHGPKGTVKIYALLDEGSSVSLLEDSVAVSLGLKGQKSSITLQWYDNMRKTETSMKVNVEISPIGENYQKYVIKNLHTVRELSLPVQSFEKARFEYLQHLPIEDYVDKKPAMLIGLDNCFLGLADRIVEAGPNLPVASATKLGWVAYGPSARVGNSVARICHINDGNTLKDIAKMVEDYFSIENFGVRSTDLVLESDDDKRSREILKNSTRKIEDRYETGLLWKNDDTALPESFEMAKQRLIKVENRMSRDPVYAANYKREIAKYIDKGYARLLPSTNVKNNNCNKVWYLPHFGVTNPHKPEKLRIVFDAAATTSNISLNSVLMKGPEHAKSLQTILYQFRQGKIAVAGDIQEMFSQVAIVQADQNCQRFLWRDGDKSRKIQIYVMQSMIFGAICSPCCAEYVKNFNAKVFESTMPRGTNAVINHTYVDDLVISFNNLQEAQDVTNEARQINAAAGFKLRNFSSNCLELEARLNDGDNGKSTTFNMERQNQTDKILGLYWNKSTDCFQFHVKFYKICHDVLDGRRPPTKREVLGIIMAIFDPFGFLANFTIFSKLLLQQTWKLCIQWDEQLPQNILAQWNAWWREFDKVKQFSIARCHSSFLCCADEIQLHVFVDASSKAYAAVAYLRIKYNNSVQVSFVVAKSRCAPPRGMTIPRLELQAAVLGCRLKTSIEESHDFKIDETIFWSDSKTIVLWIQSTVREYKQFVACRISEILSTTDPKQWRWLPTDLNVADEATRAKLPVAFDPNSKWLTGPKFLEQNEYCWPGVPQFTETDQCYDEEKINKVLILRTAIVPVLNLKLFSSFLKMKRYAAWVLRFINVYVRKCKGVTTELTAAEIDAGEKLICRLVQMEVWSEQRLCLIAGKSLPKSCNIYPLSPYVDDDMLLRVNGRIDNAYYLPDTARRPIIMPTKHPITVLIVTYYHRLKYHQNDQLILNEVRQKFWVPNIRSVLKLVKKCCPTCIRDSAKPAPPLMGQLPFDRLTPYVRPFSYVGLDYCGPFYVTIGRRNEKRWIALFTCLSTRALHLEISVDLSTDAFLICLRNFVNRRGVPIRIRSDNGTNFIGAQKEITPENRFFDFNEIQRNLSKDNIEWVFNCPANPHAGGCWERLVRCVKRLLYKVLKEERPRLETFRSAMIEAESIINNRPLTELLIDSESEGPLTPNHFLIGGIGSTQTPGSDEEKVCLRKQWRIAQNLKDRLWKRWVVEYLPQLLRRPKWREETPALQPGNLVIVLDSNLPRSQWKTGRITQVFPGKDGLVRSAEVKTSNGFIRRPAVKLAVLRFNESSA